MEKFNKTALKSEGEKLKEVADIIWYKFYRIDWDDEWKFFFNEFDSNNTDEYFESYDLHHNKNILFYNDIFYKKINDLSDWFWADYIYNYTELDVREIIFTQEFMDKYLIYYSDNIWILSSGQIVYGLSLNLNNPVEYLANLLEIN